MELTITHAPLSAVTAHIAPWLGHMTKILKTEKTEWRVHEVMWCLVFVCVFVLRYHAILHYHGIMCMLFIVYFICVVCCLCVYLYYTVIQYFTIM